ncbi:hypothetical protein ACFVUS_26990 [Nocardia sp. NPDC058058]|uniref:hypothetical protein n=1 Tax=Nocardia sp. NPDC058058 TaxID=3346317 RepID=UPI0036D7E898
MPEAAQLAQSSDVNDAIISATDLQNRFAEVPNGFARVVAAGVFEPVDAATYRVVGAELSGLLDRLEAVGVPMADALHEVERMKADSDRFSRRVVDMVRENAWEPFANSDRTQEDLSAFTARVDVLRSILRRTAGELVNRFIDQYLAQDAEISSTLRSDS